VTVLWRNAIMDWTLMKLRNAIRGLLLGAVLLAGPVRGQQAPLTQAQGLLKEGRPQEALQILLELQRSGPPDANVSQQIGIAYTQLENLAEAEKAYREAVRLNPKFWAARKNLATVLWFLDHKEESEREFLAVTHALPADPVPHLYLGLAAHARRNQVEAKAQFEKAGALASENPEVLPIVVEAYAAAGDLSLPARVTQQLAAAENPDPALLSRVGALLLQYGRYELAVTALEKLTALHKESADGWRMLAEAYAGERKLEPAYRAYSHAIEADPNSADAYVAMAEFASAHANNEFALEVVGRGLRQAPRSAELLFEQGALLAIKGDRSQAETRFVEASKIRPAWNLPLLALGVSQLESGDAAQAVATFQRARTVEPSDSRGHYLYANALAKINGESGKDRAGAIAALRKAIELNSRDARSHTLLGQLLLAAGETNAAAIEWQRALKIDPENATALYQLGTLYRKQGKVEDARRLLDSFQRVKAKKRAEEESLVDILKVAPERRAP
jgi:Flp pilus assembly protein TadD